MIDCIGWIGSVLFAFCGLPQAIKAYRTRSVADLSWLFLLMWWLGEILTFVYVCTQPTLQIPLLANYTFNFLIVTYLIYVKRSELCH